jgi:hypothetical protein
LVHSLQPPKEASEEKDDSSEFFPTDSENINYIVHLNDTTFDGFITENAQSPMLTVFYALCKYEIKNQFSQQVFLHRVWTL